MGIESFSYIKPSVANGDNVVLVSQAWGDPVTGKVPVEAAGTGNIQRAGLFSTAPYRPDDDPTRKAKPSQRDGKCTALDNTCNAWATKTYPGLCVFHARQKTHRLGGQ